MWLARVLANPGEPAKGGVYRRGGWAGARPWDCWHPDAERGVAPSAGAREAWVRSRAGWVHERRASPDSVVGPVERG